MAQLLSVGPQLGDARINMIIVEFIIEVLFFTVCGFVGHVVVKALTFGKIDLEWGSGSESVLTEWLGFFFILFTAGITAWICKS